MSIGQTSLSAIRDALNDEGLGLRLGPYAFRVRSSLPLIARAVQTLHAHRPFQSPHAVSDFTLDFQPGIERLRRSVICSVDGEIWHSWPTRLTVAAMEWVTSWCYFRSPWNHLAIHGAAAVHPETDRAIIFPGLSGAGKSTLASTLMLSGWTLLSDEISLFGVTDQTVVGLGRPTILKGASLELIRQRFPDRAIFGPEGKILEPRGPIAHLQPTVRSVEASGKTYEVAAFVFPCRDDGGPASPRLVDVSAKDNFVKISQLGINYRQLGEKGFRAALALSRTRPAYQMHYRDASKAEAFLRVCREVSSRDLAALPTPAEPAPDVAPRMPVSSVPSSSNETLGTTNVPSRCESPVEISELVGCINAAMQHPDVAVEWSDEQWGAILPLANHMELLPQLAARWTNLDAFEQLPVAVQDRLRREVQKSDFTRVNMRYEMEQVARLLSDLGTPLVLLKGCAYLLADQAWALGRRTSDVDLLIQESSVDAAAKRLLEHHFEVDDKLSEKDTRYYRRWLHELPPIKHQYRKLEIDLHFRLLPVGDPSTFDASPLIERATAIAGTAYHWLDPVDRVIHAAINLGRTGEFRRAFRDMWDIRKMTEVALAEGDFDWGVLSQRAREIRISGTVARVMLLAQQCIDLPLPEGWCEATTGRPPEKVRGSRLYRLMFVGATPDGRAYRSRRRRAANWMLEHYPLPKLRTWLDPLTWTKRATFLREDPQ